MNLRSLVVFALLVGLLAGCGVRGELEPPPGASTHDRDEPAAIDPLIKPQ
jgi:predicted small lipoprotein YifL